MAVSSEARHLMIESWSLYGITITIVLARFVSRRLLLQEWRRLRVDDYLMLLATLTYTAVIVFVNVTAQHLCNYLPAGVYETLSPQDIKDAIFGSKSVFITEEFILATLWLCKACLLILYSGLTTGLPKQHRMVKYVGAYCVFGYIFVQIFFLGVWCRPLEQYWWVPVQNTQCASYYHHLITSSVFNISSDLMMLLIPIPLLYRARLPPKRKAILLAVFSLGIFVVLASILNRYYNFTEPYGSLVYLYWYAGESSTAVMVANIPHCWPVVARMFRLSSFKMYGASGGATPQYGNTGVESGTGGANRRSRFGGRSTSGYTKNTRDQSEDADSIERIVGKDVIITTANASSKDDLATSHAMGVDVELGSITHAPATTAQSFSSPSSPPGYQARATADRSSVRIPNLRGHKQEGSTTTPHGGIVKTIEVDQKYSNE